MLLNILRSICMAYLMVQTPVAIMTDRYFVASIGFAGLLCWCFVLFKGSER